MAVGLGAMNILWGFELGGAMVSLFAFIWDIVRPKRLAGLFGGAPSVAPATGALTVAGYRPRELIAKLRTGLRVGSDAPPKITTSHGFAVVSLRLGRSRPCSSQACVRADTEVGSTRGLSS
jgi:hypothetical protein